MTNRFIILVMAFLATTCSAALADEDERRHEVWVAARILIEIKQRTQVAFKD